MNNSKGSGLFLPIIVMLIFPVLGVSAVFIYFNPLTLWSQMFLSIFTGLLNSFILYVFVENKLKIILGLQDQITITLKNESNKATYSLPAKIRRRDFSRGEVLGRIGMIPLTEAAKGKGPKFEIKYTNSEDFIDKIHEVYDKNGDKEIIIKCDPEEFEQFNYAQVQRDYKS
ncbi:hypothetical protein [Gynuella sp.]|uniref:hypothetical protein n=1 Tax=Gynuella sp. TaxID=2969146 RepID=UPI003D12CFEF